MSNHHVSRPAVALVRRSASFTARTALAARAALAAPSWLRRARHAAPFALAAAAMIGCSSAPVADVDPTAASGEAVLLQTEQYTSAYQTPGLSLLYSMIQQSTLAVASSHVAFTPSADLSAALHLATATNPLGVQGFDIPLAPMSVSGATIEVLGVDGSVDLSQFTVEVQGSDLVALAPAGSATVRLRLTYLGISVTPTIHVPSLSASVKLVWNTQTDRLAVDANGVSLQMPGAYVSDCGAIGWCDPIGNAAIAAVQGQLGPKLTDALNGVLTIAPAGLSVPTATTAFEQISLRLCALAAPAKPPQGSTAWGFAAGPLGYEIAPGSLSIANDTVSCQLVRTDNPLPLVYSVTPSSAGVGDTVTIAGDNLSVFGQPTAVTFNGVPSPVVNCTSDMLCTAVVPNGYGYGRVQVTAFGYTSAAPVTPNFAWRAPIVTSLAPATGALAGGTVVHLAGGGFDPNASTDGLMSVFFGGVPSPNVWCAGNTDCYAQAPSASLVGAVPVTVAAYGVTTPSATAPSFTYRSNAALSSLALTPAMNQGSVSLDSFAPAGGAVVSLSSANATAVTVPATVTIPAGASSARFSVSGTMSTATGGYVAVTASYLVTTSQASVAVMNGPAGNTTTCGGAKKPVSGCALPKVWKCCSPTWMCGGATATCQ